MDELSDRDARLLDDIRAIIPEEWWKEIPGARTGWASMAPHYPGQLNLKGVFLEIDLPSGHYENSLCAYPHILEDDEAKRRQGLAEKYKVCLEELKAKIRS